MRSLSRIVSLLSFAVLVGGLFLTGTSAAQAHERRSVGAYNLVVGWTGEPAYINTPNNVDLRVSRASDATPVTGLEQTLKVTVTADGKSIDVQLRPRFNTPGAYDGRLTPTAKGAYSFKLTGTIEGQQINETFTAGEGTFGLIEEPLVFPNSLPTNQSLDESLTGLEQRLVTLEEGEGSDDSSTALLVGIAGVLFGIAGLGTGAYALSKKS